MTKATTKRIAKLFGELCAWCGLEPVNMPYVERGEALHLVCRMPGASTLHGVIELPTTLRGNQAERAIRAEFSEMLTKLREAVAA
ncbi:MAG TPA: hypothetical protein VGK73_31405 [Polyangiaceae bacterium]